MALTELKILPTKYTPEIILNPKGMIKIRGRSMKTNLNALTKQVYDWLDEYLRKPEEITCFDFHLEYLNTNNAKFYINCLKKIEFSNLKNKKYIVNWYYDEGDEDILEKGEFISSALKVPFNFIKMTTRDDIS